MIKMNWRGYSFCSLRTPPSLAFLFCSLPFFSLCIISYSQAVVSEEAWGGLSWTQTQKTSPLLVIMDTTLLALWLSSSGSSKVPLIPSHPTPGLDGVTLYFPLFLFNPPFHNFFLVFLFLFSDPSSSVCVHIYCSWTESWCSTLLSGTA